MNYLLADLGGTHLRLAQSQNDKVQLVEKLVCADFDSLEAAISYYLNAHPLPGPRSCCLAVAAPLLGDQVQMTNSPWNFSLEKLKQGFGFDQLYALNDFEAIAHAVPHLQDNQLQQLGGSNKDAQGNMAVLGPGTGLGVKHLTFTSTGWKVLMGEGGHVDFAPVDETDLMLWQCLQKTQSSVVAEDLLSGRGLLQIYRALCASKQTNVEFDDVAEVISAALSKSCPTSEASADQFLRILGSFAGNLALNLNTTGGVYLCGGVAMALAPMLAESRFRDRFEAKGRFKNYVAGIPAFLVKEAEPGLLGALRFLQLHTEKAES
ncbi:glk [Symbiodinium microadriaticum]|nr:glk [Symbiodinium microadriaticum]